MPSAALVGAPLLAGTISQPWLPQEASLASTCGSCQTWQKHTSKLDRV
jgi:hypothetical protein